MSPFGLSRASEDELEGVEDELEGVVDESEGVVDELEGVVDDFTDDLEKKFNILIVAKMIGSSVANGAWLRLQETGEAKYE